MAENKSTKIALKLCMISENGNTVGLLTISCYAIVYQCIETVVEVTWLVLRNVTTS